jgi:hypothetical protein
MRRYNVVHTSGKTMGGGVHLGLLMASYRSPGPDDSENEIKSGSTVRTRDCNMILCSTYRKNQYPMALIRYIYLVNP